MNSFSRLKDGSWGVRAQENVRIGQAIQVQRRDGKAFWVTVVEIVAESSDNGTLCKVVPYSKKKQGKKDKELVAKNAPTSFSLLMESEEDSESKTEVPY